MRARVSPFPFFVYASDWLQNVLHGVSYYLKKHDFGLLDPSNETNKQRKRRPSIFVQKAIDALHPVYPCSTCVVRTFV